MSADAAQVIMPTYARLPVTFARGEGLRLWDEAGEEYLDAMSGIAVNSLGHSHPALTDALSEQLGQLVHTSNYFGIAHQTTLAERLCELSGMSQVFFGNSGAEANECALKIAREFGKQQGIEAPKILVMDEAFHGRTLATYSASRFVKEQSAFYPFADAYVKVPFGDVSAVAEQLVADESIVAVMLEPILGEAGIKQSPKGYLAELRTLCDQHKKLLILDEIQTGLCRTGRWFAHQHEGITPDVMTLAKALGNGVPIGACLVQGAAQGLLKAGFHGSTFGGSPLACRAALAVLEVMSAENLADNAAAMGLYLKQGLERNLADNVLVEEVSGIGLMLAISLAQAQPDIVRKALSNKLLITLCAGNRVRLLPALTITQSECDEIINRLTQVFDEAALEGERT